MLVGDPVKIRAQAGDAYRVPNRATTPNGNATAKHAAPNHLTGNNSDGKEYVYCLKRNIVAPV